MPIFPTQRRTIDFPSMIRCSDGRIIKALQCSQTDRQHSYKTDPTEASAFFLEEHTEQSVNALCTSENRITKSHQDNLHTCVAKIVPHIVITRHHRRPHLRCANPSLHVCSTLRRNTRGIDLALALARSRKKKLRFMGPPSPTAPAKMTKRALARGPSNAGYVRSFARLAHTRATPSLLAAPGLAEPSQWRGHT